MSSAVQQGPAVVVVEAPGGALRVVSGSADSPAGALVVVRRGGRTLDVRRAPHGWEAAEVARDANERERAPIFPEAPGLSVTVAICTLGAHPRLEQAVRSVLAQTLPDANMLVVDNDPASGATRAALAELGPRVRIIDEPQRGLSNARNAAIRAAQTDVLAFTDDDAVIEDSWLERLVQPFALHPNVAAVTGLVVPAELRTPAQRFFEAYIGFGKGVEHTYWTLDPELDQQMPGEPGPRGVLFPWTAGKVGSGNNMAFRTQVLRDLGGFDFRLGAGAVTQGGEELDVFTRVLLAGHIIAYTPDALVWHYHRETMAELRQQIRANGVGMGAVITKAVLSDPRVLPQVGRRGLAVAQQALGSRGRQRETAGEDVDSSPRFRLILEEILGLTQGPWKYAKARRRDR